MHRMLFAWLVLTAPLTAQDAVQSTRRWDATVVRLSEMFSDDTAGFLLNPQLIQLCGNHLLVLNVGGPHIAAFTLDLVPLWRAGRLGSGPGEWRVPTDLACDDVGRIWVADPATSRLTVYGPDGTFHQVVSLQHPWERVAPNRAGTVALVAGGLSKDHLAVAVGIDGVERATIGVPAAFANINQLAREGYLARTADGGAVMGFRWSSQLLRVGPDYRIAYVQDGVEHIDIPTVRAYPAGRGATMVRIDPKAAEASRRLAVADGVIHVLFRGRTTDAGRVIDRYRLSDGTYLGSFRLPVSADGIAIRRQTVYALVADPVPGIVRYTLVPSRK